MSMVCGLDLHRGQITFDILEEESGEVWRGRIWKPDRQRFRRWLESEVAPRADCGEVKLAVEGCTDWRYLVEEIAAVGFEAHVAEPADTQAMRGRKHRAKTDRTDARLLRDLLAAGELPESWIPPEAVLDGGSERDSTRAWWISGRCGCSGSTPSSTSTASRCPRNTSARRTPASCCRAPICRWHRRPASASPSATG